MCTLTSILGSKCGHTLRIEYIHCESAPQPNRCPGLISCIGNSSLDTQIPFCARCAQGVKAKAIADFHDERREMTKVARAGRWSDEAIRAMRIELRDQLYKKLKYVDKPLPALPGGSGGGGR